MEPFSLFLRLCQWRNCLSNSCVADWKSQEMILKSLRVSTRVMHQLADRRRKEHGMTRDQAALPEGLSDVPCPHRLILCLMPIRHGSWSTTLAGTTSVPILQAFYNWLGKSAPAPDIAAARTTDAAGTFGRFVLSGVSGFFWPDVSCGLFGPMQRSRRNYKDFGSTTH